MIEKQNWKSELLESFDSVEQLFNAGILSISEAQKLKSVESYFKIRIPSYYVSLMETEEEKKSDCVIRLQALPNLNENDPEIPSWAEEWSLKCFNKKTPWTQDSIGDQKNLIAPRLTHRYENRVLLHTSSLCAMYCRFCFRKSHLNDSDRPLYQGSFQEAFNYLKQNPEVTEIILTGGDPLSLTDSAIAELFSKLNLISSIKTVRIHSKMPVTMPSRISSDLISAFNRFNRNLILVTHFNHPKELTSLALDSLKKLKSSGLSLYNQSVLLKKINNKVSTLKDLFQGLYEEAGVHPYYLHHTDWTPGTFHFRSSIEEGKHLYRELQGSVSGPALPKYVLDLPFGTGKIPLTDEHFISLQESRYQNGFFGELYKIKSASTLQEKSDHFYCNFWN